MVRSVIHSQHHPSGWIFRDQQAHQKVDELRAILGFSDAPGDLVFDPVVVCKHMAFLFEPWLGRRNASLLPNLHPPLLAARPPQRLR